MNSLQAYQEVAGYSEVLGASERRKLELLFIKLVKELDAAVDAMEKKEVKNKCKSISNAHHIVSFLRSLLNDENGQLTEAEEKLEGIYQHLERLLLLANSKNDIPALQECREIANNLHQWWRQLEL